jgi:DNA-binding transcriptional LysR family regulator
MDVHTRHLRYFVTVADQLSFTAAARLLYVSQPALSKQIRVLERELGFELFYRTARGISLTAQGEAMLPSAHEMLRAWDAGMLAARAASHHELVVGMQTAVGRGIQRRAMERFTTAMPQCRVTLRIVDWSDPSAGLADGTSDVAFLWRPVPAPELNARTVATERRVVTMASDHQLAKRPTLAMADLLDEPFIALPEIAGPVRDYWLAIDARQGTPAVIGAVAATADEVFEAVAAGVGLVLLAEGNAELYSRPGIVTRTVDDLTPAELVIAWRTGDTRPSVTEFISALTETR